MKKYLIGLIFLFAFFLFGFDAEAQCAMCRSSLESNVSDGEVGVSTQLNLGILYLLAAPYLLFFLMAFFWYRTSKRNGKRISLQGYLKN